MTKENWIKSAQKLFNKAPADIWIFVGNGTICIMQSVNGERMMDKNGCVDQKYCLGEISGVPADGGDW